MTPPIFDAVNVPAVRALLKTGTGPLRFYMFGIAQQKVIYPYAVWRLVSGLPENYLADRPDIDSLSAQVDVYADAQQGPTVTRAIAAALRDAIEGHAYITAWRGESVDPDTQSWNTSFDTEWFVPR